MNSFEKLASRIGSESWRQVDDGYSPSPAEMDGVIHSLKIISGLARHDTQQTTQHVLASPARMLGYVPSVATAEAIEDYAIRLTDAYAKVLVRNALEWADMVSSGELPAGLPPDLFAPLLILLENGCSFRLSKGFLEVGDKAIPIHGWPVLVAG